MANKYPNIVCTNDTLWGSPRIDGRRLAVGDIVSFLKHYGTLTEVINDYELTLSEIKQALQYCANLQCKQDKPTVYCHNCSLRRQQEGPLDISNAEEVTSNDMTFVKNDNSIYLGTMNELLDQWNGHDWWIIATDLLIDLRDDVG